MMTCQRRIPWTAKGTGEPARLTRPRRAFGPLPVGRCCAGEASAPRTAAAAARAVAHIFTRTQRLSAALVRPPLFWRRQAWATVVVHSRGVRGYVRGVRNERLPGGNCGWKEAPPVPACSGVPPRWETPGRLEGRRSGSEHTSQARALACVCTIGTKKNAKSGIRGFRRNRRSLALNR